jgi:zinc D-Ala-D-Ala carboxypeptidase
MRLIYVLLVSFLALTACGQVDELLNKDETEKIDQVVSQPTVDSKTEMLTAQEKLALELPANADLEDWNLILVNPWEALPSEFDPNLVVVMNEQQIDSRITQAWEDWYKAALDAGHQLFFASGHRTVERQSSNFNRTYNNYLSEGYSEEEALLKTKEYLTEPGHSEHHTGLAFDLLDQQWVASGRTLEPDYDSQASQQWLVDTMSDYGFILRYPKGKEEITGIQYESWHFRYVGVEHAHFMELHDLVLEEYIELIKLRDEM